jgi:hypothetical protein
MADRAFVFASEACNFDFCAPDACLYEHVTTRFGEAIRLGIRCPAVVIDSHIYAWWSQRAPARSSD